jgi:hypothetical protein
MTSTIDMGQALCLPIPPGAQDCQLRELHPPDPLMEASLNPSCGLEVKVYQPGTHRVKWGCGEETWEQALEVNAPHGFSQEDLAMPPPLIALEPLWGLWALSGLGVMLVLVGLAWTVRGWLRRRGAPASLPDVAGFPSDYFLGEFGKLIQHLSDGTLTPKQVAFQTTLLFFRLSREATKPFDQKFRKAYWESCQRWIRIKFDPTYSAPKSEVEDPLINGKNWVQDLHNRQLNSKR